MQVAHIEVILMDRECIGSLLYCSCIVEREVHSKLLYMLQVQFVVGRVSQSQSPVLVLCPRMGTLLAAALCSEPLSDRDLLIL